MGNDDVKNVENHKKKDASNECFGNEIANDEYTLGEESESKADLAEDESSNEFKQLAQAFEEILLTNEKLRQEAKENYDQFLMARADLENFRRRAKKEKEDALKYAAMPLMESLLPVLDNLGRALGTASQQQDLQGLYEGVEMVYRQLLESLEKAGLVPIQAVGKPFDPHQHNAVIQVEEDGVDPDMVVEEIQVGYTLFDRVIRPAMVKVSK